MPRFRITRSPGDDDGRDRTVSFDVGEPGKKQRRGLFGRAPAEEEQDPAPWEVETDIGESVAPSRHDRNVPTAPRLARAGSKARMKAVGASTPDADVSVGRLKSVERLAAISTEHSAVDTDDPWAKSAGGAAYDAAASLPPPAPVPPDPVSSSHEVPAPASEPRLGLGGAGGGGFDSDSFWGEPDDVSVAVEGSSKRGADSSFAPPRFEGQSLFDVQAVSPREPSDEFLGAASDFDVDVGFTHDSVADMGLTGWDDTSASSLGFADEGPIESHDPFAPARSGQTRGSLQAHDMSYPDIPTLTVDDALSRGSELLEQGQAEDALSILEMGLRMEPSNAALRTWVDFAERKVLADILPEARSDRVLRLVPAEPPGFADPRDAKLAESVRSPRTFSALREEHSVMSMREFAGRVSAMIAMRVMAWDD